MNTVFIVDTYNPASSLNKNVRYIYRLNDRQWCIREISLEWGLPQLPIQLTDNAPEPQDFHLFNTYEEALNYVKLLKEVNK